ncbi:MAG: ABC transporter ATP-binding protein [Mycetocola sp.]
MTPALTLTGVTHGYGAGTTGVRALADVSMSVAAGELVAVMGPSGSGKSTLLSVAGGLEHPHAGTVELGGTQLRGLDRAALAQVRRRSVGFVFQRYNLIPLLTALENVALPLELDRWPARHSAQAARDALTLVGMSAQASAYPEELSGGQQQRVAIARALAGTPRLILADEPTGALDSVTGDAVIRMLRDRVDEGAAAIVVTHDPRLAAWADRVLTLDDGVLHEPVGSAR